MDKSESWEYYSIKMKQDTAKKGRPKEVKRDGGGEDESESERTRGWAEMSESLIVGAFSLCWDLLRSVNLPEGTAKRNTINSQTKGSSSRHCTNICGRALALFNMSHTLN